MGVKIGDGHQFAILRFPYFSAPHRWLAACSCGDWSGQGKGGEGEARNLERAWLQHLRAKEGTT